MTKAEAAIQKALVAWIKENYPDVGICAAQNENSHKAKAQGMDVGTPDLHLRLRHNGILYIFYHELKTKKGKPLASQERWAKKYQRDFMAHNTYYCVSYGIEKARIIFNLWYNSIKSIKSY